MFRQAGAGVVILALAPGPLLPTGPVGQAPTERYSARHNGDVVQLHDTASDTRVSIIPSAGNIAVEMRVKGHHVLRFPYDSPEEYKSRGGGSIGIPFLAPWADRLDEQAFYANGRRYAFDISLGNIRGANPIHGFLGSTNLWRVSEVRADATSAWVTSRLEFFRNPLWMKQFPFAHTIEMTHRLQDGVLEVATRIENLSIDPMPVAIGFHPYFQLTDSRRNEWTVSVGARTHWPVAENKMPKGETQPIEKFFPDPRAVALKDFDLDDVFTDLVRSDQGRAAMTVKGKAQRLDVLLGERYRAVVIYAPRPQQTPEAGGRAAPNRNFICLEPVAGIINALNLAHRGLYTELQSVPPSGVWQESFWVRPSGF
jgi:aldose 1-epimerase